MKFKYLDFRKRALILNLCLGHPEINDVDFFMTEEGIEGVHVRAGIIEDDTYSCGVVFVESLSDMDTIVRDTQKAIVDAIEGYHDNLENRKRGEM